MKFNFRPKFPSATILPTFGPLLAGPLLLQINWTSTFIGSFIKGYLLIVLSLIVWYPFRLFAQKERTNQSKSILSLVVILLTSVPLLASLTLLSRIFSREVIIVLVAALVLRALSDAFSDQKKVVLAIATLWLHYLIVAVLSLYSFDTDFKELFIVPAMALAFSASAGTASRVTQHGLVRLWSALPSAIMIGMTLLGALPREYFLAGIPLFLIPNRVAEERQVSYGQLLFLLLLWVAATIKGTLI